MRKGTKEKIDQVNHLINQGASVTAALKKAGTTYATFHKHKTRVAKKTINNQNVKNAKTLKTARSNKTTKASDELTRLAGFLRELGY